MTGVALFRLCQRPACGELRRVRDRATLSRPGYCSHRCAAIGNRLGVELGKQRRRRVLDRVHGLTPLDAFRLGYVRGLESKLRQIRRRYDLVPRLKATA